LGDVAEGIKDFGLFHKPIWSAGHLKGSKSKPKLWVFTRSKPKPSLELGERGSIARVGSPMTGSAPPEVVLVSNEVWRVESSPQAGMLVGRMLRP
jgi:hypothetical protein